ncbi:putative mitochondrial mitochondrial processing peptidase alpha subunit [Leptomonas pyrrhocoris]|uniref:Putative mitochondrial mitochondrial processing peptidase alpha subunit n=1 Tax=Leptomonas pyrrhocoris TaxID=157538 RepID=A0A0M9FUP6_LEPPY|nr:putative mitochondrial mitochondrial processing peptidase alpha subunit [Leptomonas pyrrhocoris]XP_015654901.1 putative mitochondrial mitochondrial processing peptidase alpha subunit [Leptomonas pyrrhocoris]XP_015654902.1 putative mitochondrial mitochondrial processing peptidase alpha subunit [Leptomonas pyrrhocoris]XP_015654903.1 putative mitochondrial mitochondrial processing peptidase alpha subunit [Leptomonas pyrrhocoris]XP_015654904.1 putative mitochondrial mitochondrial processing pept|eukprot:XP_015654900.1 putative mitochondrial mitochondrial processing peptidase alpha subunit [Leptomonas pyrrhocoris]
MLRRVVASARAASGTQTRGIYQYKFGQTPLTKPFSVGARSRLPPAPPSPAPATAAAKVEVTKLHNGVRVISHNLGGPTVSVGAYILAGPAYDPPSAPGTGAMMHLALTTSNYNNALFQLDRNIRSVGAAQSHFEKSKHYIGIRIDARADKWKSAATSAPRSSRRVVSSKPAEEQFSLNLVQDNIFTCIAAPRFHEPDVERFRDTIDNQVEELRWQYPAEYAKQMLETVAFYREPLGNPRFVPALSNGTITSNVLLDQYSRYVVPSRVVVAGVNVDHAALVAEYENTPFPHSASAPHHARAQAPKINVQNEAAQYTGGERQDHEDRAKVMGTKPDMDTETICAVGWLAYGKDRKTLRDYAASMVVKAILDVQFGDSMRYARDEMHEHTGLRAFYSPFETAGLIGFTAKAEPKSAVRMVTDAVKGVQAHKASVADSMLAMAKSMARTQILVQNTDTIRDYCDYLGTSLSVEDCGSTVPTSIDELVDAVSAVTAADVKKVFDMMFSHKASLYGHGEMLGFPSMRQMGI